MTCFNLECDGQCTIYRYDKNIDGCNSDGQCDVDGDNAEDCFDLCDCFEEDK